jgi:hypothetical protein
LELNGTDFNLDNLLQETLRLTEFISLKKETDLKDSDIDCATNEFSDLDYLYDLADGALIGPELHTKKDIDFVYERPIPTSPGIVYKIDEGGGTFCVRGFSSENLKKSFEELSDQTDSKRIILKMPPDSSNEGIYFFETKSFELAESIREQIINRRFPKLEDSVCNISDPGFSWWMDVSLSSTEGRFEIFFKSHAVNRAERCIQLGPIGDFAIANLRLNQARSLIKSSFPLTEFICTDRSLIVASSKPDHLSFISFKNIFLLGENHTVIDNFPDNTLGRTLYFYFHEVAVIRKFWIEVMSRLS